MEIFNQIVAVIGGIGVIVGAVGVATRVIQRFADGQKALLRAQMLETYYKYQETQKVPQYELENFWKCYDAYKAMKGNSFIDDIKNEVETWTSTR